MKLVKRAVRAATAAVTRLGQVAPYHAPVARINRWALDAGPARRRVHGVDFELDLREHVQRYIYYTAHEPEFTRDFLAVLRPGQTVIDAGAHVGYFSLLAARRVGPSGRVLAVEPVAGNAARIRHNARRNGLDNVTVAETALGDGEGELLLHGAGGDNEGTYSVSTVDADARRTVRVPLTTLDRLADAHTLPAVDVIKVDVQGAELGLLQGARDLLGRTSPVLFCEIHPRHLRDLGSSAQEVFELLKRAGFAPGTVRAGRLREGPVVLPDDEAMVVFGKVP